MNLVSMIMSFLAPALINRMAGSLGIGQGLAGKAISAAIPAILAAMAGQAGKSGGAGILGSILSKQDPNLLGNFANMIGGSGQQALITNGTGALNSLLGGPATSALAGAVGKFAGINSGQSGSLMGMLAPVVLGQLAQTQQSKGLDANGVASLLADQKDSIAAAMPAGFSNLLQGAGLSDMMPSMPKAPAMAAMAPAPSSGSGGSFAKWALPLGLGLLGLYALTNLMSSKAPQTVPAAKTTEPATAPAATPSAAPAAAPKAEIPAIPGIPGGELAGIATKALSSLTQTIGSVKDVETAKAAIPSLTDTAKQIDGLKTAAAALSGDARKPLALLIGAALPSVTQAIDRAAAIPGVGDVLKPVVDPMIANLSGLAK